MSGAATDELERYAVETTWRFGRRQWQHESGPELCDVCRASLRDTRAAAADVRGERDVFRAHALHVRDVAEPHTLTVCDTCADEWERERALGSEEWRAEVHRDIESIIDHYQARETLAEEAAQ